MSMPRVKTTISQSPCYAVTNPQQDNVVFDTWPLGFGGRKQAMANSQVHQVVCPTKQETGGMGCQ